MQTGELIQDYIFNQGIFHFGLTGQAFGTDDAYDPYLGHIKKEASPSYQRGVIDDYGVIIAAQGLRISNLKHKMYGLSDIDGSLELNNASVENYALYVTHGRIQGFAPSFANYGLFTGHSFSPDYTMGTYFNEGNMLLSHHSIVVAEDEFTNNNFIYGKGNLEVGSRKKVSKVGAVAAEGEVKALIAGLQELADTEKALKETVLFSKKRKGRIIHTHHTDHYLNTITNHYVQDAWGSHFSHKTETGYVFQRRTTETSEHEVEAAALPDELARDAQALMNRQAFVKRLRDSLTDHFKKMGTLKGIHGELLHSLMDALKAAGLDDSDVTSILRDEYINGVLEGISALSLVEGADVSAYWPGIATPVPSWRI